MAATTEHLRLQDLTLVNTSKHLIDPIIQTEPCICCQSNTQQSAKSFALCKQCKIDLAETQQAYLYYTQSPIHHTLSNATISYDSLYRDVHGFVKRDVFLAPAAAAESDSDYETVSTPIMVQQQEDPAFLIEDAHSLFGVDGLLSQRLHKQSTMLGLGIVTDKNTPLEDLPTPPAAVSDSEDTDSIVLCRKRKRSSDLLLSRVQHTPPTSPMSVALSESPDQDDTSDKRFKCNNDSEFDQSEARSPSPSSFSWSSGRRYSWSSVGSEEEQEEMDQSTPSGPTIFEKFTDAEVDWCRYCGTTEGVNWRPGPWGKRTLCNKHGCDYKGYGFACKLPRLNLTEFEHESIQDRVVPVLQLFCSTCQERECNRNMIRCAGCPRAFHSRCLEPGMEWNSSGVWYCTSTCQESSNARRIVVDLPRKRLPLMSTPRQPPRLDVSH